MTLDLPFMVEMAYALGIGLLVGLERTMEVAQRDDPPPRASMAASTQPVLDTEKIGEFLGVRTFAVFSLVGFGAGLAAESFSFMAPMALLGISLVIVAMYYRNQHAGYGITTEIAAIGTFILGMLCHQDPRVAGVLALLLTVVLASKRFTYRIVGKMRRVELTDTLKFLVVILIVLPLLPREALDPFGAFNPYKVGVLVVLISGISFVGYFLTRILGAQRGLGLTGVLGGLTSSTAVTAAMAADARAQPQLRSICTFSTVVANATMFVRVLVVVALLDRALVARLAWPLGGMAVTAALAAVVLWFLAAGTGGKATEGRSPIQLKNPFSIVPALKFGAFFILIIFVAKLARLYFGDSGLYAASALSGLADVDAITLSITESARDGTLSRQAGALGITIAVVSNSFVKTGIAFYSGGTRFGGMVAICLGAATVVGLLLAFLL